MRACERVCVYVCAKCAKTYTPFSYYCCCCCCRGQHTIVWSHHLVAGVLALSTSNSARLSTCRRTIWHMNARADCVDVAQSRNCPFLASSSNNVCRPANSSSGSKIKLNTKSSSCCVWSRVGDYIMYTCVSLACVPFVRACVFEMATTRTRTAQH